MRTRKDLTAIKGISEAKLDKVLEAAAKLKVHSLQLAVTYLEVVLEFYDRFGLPDETERSDSSDNWEQEL